MEYKNNMPIYIQVVGDIKMKILNGELKVGEKLPSNNDLALMYKINPNTVQRIYKELELEKICYVRRGVGTFVSEDQELPDKLRGEIVVNTVNEYLESMKKIGYSVKDAINAINQYKGE